MLGDRVLPAENLREPEESGVSLESPRTAMPMLFLPMLHTISDVRAPGQPLSCPPNAFISHRESQHDVYSYKSASESEIYILKIYILHTLWSGSCQWCSLHVTQPLGQALSQAGPFPSGRGAGGLGKEGARI